MARRTVDIAFAGPRIAVFLDGCFWHGCPEHATSPKANAEWWRAKLDRNVVRDGRRASTWPLKAGR
jgi:DNA mismatch endonuclease, patch repair protein